MKLLLTVVTAAAALAVAAWVFEGIAIGGATRNEQLVTLLVVAAIFGLVNAFVRPVVALLSAPFYILTLGLFFVVVNALMLLLTSWIADQVSVPFEVDGFWTALFGGIVISLASAAIGLLLPERRG
ncbi:MAG TPA: phage holin family protein [Nocardioidaceae bacterium]|jgi:putative membrane protein|nr:phage holin family protein [Nocardioidaceae bacterium]